MKDLFGEEIPTDIRSIRDARMRWKRDNRRPGRMGTGPEGMTCRHCKNRVHVKGGVKNYNKCLLMKAVWSHGPGTDIRCKDEACSKFERVN
jgi:hypothetical protein